MAPKAKSKGSFLKKSPWIKLQNEVNQNSAIRQKLIKTLEGHFDATVVSYFASFVHADSMLADKDAEMLENVLLAEHLYGRKLVLIMNSPGGQAMAAERIVNICRAYSGGQFEVVVPHMAKSAATMVCFGASTIWMSSTAELGPVDPQVFYDLDGSPRYISAAEYINSYNSLMTMASSANTGRIEPYLQQLMRFDSRFIQQLLSWQSLAENISIRLLQTGMMNGKSDVEIKDSIDVFLSHERLNAHGRMIGAKESLNVGLNVSEIALDSDLWEIIWELYVRSDFYVSTLSSAKIIESIHTSLKG